MNCRKSLLDRVRRSNPNADKGTDEYKRLRTVLVRIVNYYWIHDIDKGTIHSKVLNMLYLSDKEYIYNEICNELYISKNTLIRYIESYDTLAIRLLDRENPFENLTEETLLEVAATEAHCPY